MASQCIIFFPLFFEIHSFPNAKKNPHQYAMWVENINRNAPIKLSPTTASRVCSEHFSEDMIDGSGQRVILKPNAVPTIFSKSQVCILKDNFIVCRVFSTKSVQTSKPKMRVKSF